MKNLLQRSLSGLLYVLLIIAGVVLRGWWFTAIFTIVAMLAIYEVHALLAVKKAKPNRLTLIVDIVAGGLLTMAIAALNVELPGFENMALTSYILMSAFIGLMCIRLVLTIYAPGQNALLDLVSGFFSWVYVALPLGVMSYYYRFTDGGGVLLLMFVMIWLNDTGAFIVGSLMGKHKLFPSISPAKTWEGFCGGMLFSALIGVVAKLACPVVFSSFSMVTLLVMGLTVSAFATWGDLLESRIKRTVGVKDSGKIMPGHGGILDRIDSLLLVAPATLILLMNL